MATPTNQTTAATVRRRKNCRTLRKRDGLIKYARDSTSQSGEDGIIARMFELLPHSPHRYCVDVGAWDGRHLSNTFSLLVGDAENGNGEGRSKWNGVLIEADPARFRELQTLHEPLGNVCICAEVSCPTDSDQSLVSILKQNAPHLPHDFDFISIDVDGTDYWLLSNILDGGDATQGYRPKVICVEFNPTMPDDLIYIQPRNDNIRHGSSLSAIVELANASDYTLVETTLFNAFFVTNELYHEYLAEEVPDTSIESLHELNMGTDLYQLYDGTIKLWGCKKMLWHRMPMDEKKMQVVQVEDRSFPFAPAAESGSSDSESQRIREQAIDLSSYCRHFDESRNTTASLEERRECMTKLNRALQTDGFALVRGTGISRDAVKNALRAAKMFLHEANEPVRRSCLTKDRARRGYAPMCTENFASLIGKDKPNDLVKKFRIGPESDGGLNAKRNSLSSLHQPNAWPQDEVWGHENASSFRSSIDEYFERACFAADGILEAICDGIVAENAAIADCIHVLSQSASSHTEMGGEAESRNHTSILTLLGYQPGSRHKKGSKGYMRPLVSAHTDVGVIIMLHFDGGRCASLQRAADASNADPESNEWVDVRLPQLLDDDPIFVVNVGDCLSELSGGSLRSTLHRVVPCPCPSTLEDDAFRTCLALFVGLEPSASLMLPSGDEIPYETWRQRRIARASAVLKRQQGST